MHIYTNIFIEKKYVQKLEIIQKKGSDPNSPSFMMLWIQRGITWLQ